MAKANPNCNSNNNFNRRLLLLNTGTAPAEMEPQPYEVDKTEQEKERPRSRRNSKEDARKARAGRPMGYGAVNTVGDPVVRAILTGEQASSKSRSGASRKVQQPEFRAGSVEKQRKVQMVVHVASSVHHPPSIYETLNPRKGTRISSYKKVKMVVQSDKVSAGVTAYLKKSSVV